MSLLEWYLTPWLNYALFDGRARRAEYWTFMIVNVLIVAFLTSAGEASGALLFVVLLFYFAVITPTLSVTVRRLHDIGLSGWWSAPVWIWFFVDTLDILSYLLLDQPPAWIEKFYDSSEDVAVIINIVLFVFCIMNSRRGINKYGANPKGEGNSVF